MGAGNIGQASPYVTAFTIARSAASMIFRIIDRIPEIDGFSNEGKKPSDLVGDIEFRNVSFNYPARENVKVQCKYLNFKK